MNILLINYEYPPIGGGAATATAAIAGHLASLGHAVTVLTSRFRDLKGPRSGRGCPGRALSGNPQASGSLGHPGDVFISGFGGPDAGFGDPAASDRGVDRLLFLSLRAARPLGIETGECALCDLTAGRRCPGQ